MLAAALRLQYRRLLAHDPGTRFGRDPEDLHQLRVATRRLRAFLRAGRDLLDGGWADELRDELGWLGGELGPVRDLDVLLEHLRAEAALLDGEDAQAAGELVAALEEQHAGARARLVAALDSERYLALLNRLEAAAEPPLEPEQNVGLGEIWSSEHRRLRAAVKSLPEDPDDESLHALRIRAKRARYAGELAGLDGLRQGREAAAGRARRASGRGRRRGAAARAGRGRPCSTSRSPPAGSSSGSATAAAQRAGLLARGVGEAREAGREVGVIRAAGGVPVRQAGGDLEVLLVHRPRYDDWTFPKGKAEPGESDVECALREVEEETGLRCELGRELPSTSYVDGKGRPKRVRYWLMHPDGRAGSRERGR